MLAEYVIIKGIIYSFFRSCEFNYKGKTVRFKGPYSLQKIVKVKEWDEGYIVVDVKYANKKELTEDYIDLVPILERLYINAPEFLKPIKKVEVRYAS